MKPGIYQDILNADYHAGPGISKSSLDLIAKNPAYYKWAKSAANTNGPTAAQVIGSAAHELILEPLEFEKNHVLAPQVDRRTKAGKQAWSDFLEQSEGRAALNPEEWAMVHGMGEAVEQHPMASKLLNLPGKAEQSVYWNDPKTGVLCRCRPDYWAMSAGIIVDIKTTENASYDKFQRSLLDWRYYVQAPFYVDGCNEAIKQAGLDIPPVKAFVFVVIEKKAPHGVAVYELDAESIEAGRADYQENLETYLKCETFDEWPGYNDNVVEIGLPNWFLIKKQG